MNIYSGKSENGRIIEADLRIVKHLLVVGKTGTGKSNFCALSVIPPSGYSINAMRGE